MTAATRGGSCNIRTEPSASTAANDCWCDFGALAPEVCNLAVQALPGACNSDVWQASRDKQKNLHDDYHAGLMNLRSKTMRPTDWDVALASDVEFPV